MFGLGGGNAGAVAPGKEQSNMARQIIEAYDLSDRDVDRIIAMAWEDRTPFDAITFQFKLSEKEVIQLMKSEMKLRSWKVWRARVQGRKTKHRKLRQPGITRFKADRQRTITHNKVSKR